jgi:hypothetical protein
MHRLIRDHLEEVLAESPSQGGSDARQAREHLKECAECAAELAAMREQAALLRELRSPEESEVQAGFYARVMERIEAQGAASIWNLFFESPFGRRIAVASMALALLLGVYLVTSEQSGGQQVQLIAGEDQPGLVLTGAAAGTPDRDAVLVNLVTYREQ